MSSHTIVRPRRVPWAVQALLFAGSVFLVLYWLLPLRQVMVWSLGLGLVLAAGRSVAGHARLQLAEASLVDRARRGESGQPKDGERIAVLGTLETEAAVLHSPLRGTPCVAYHYQAYHRERRRGSSTSSDVVDYAGIGMVPLVIRSESSSVAIGGYPWFADFAPFNEISSEEGLAKGRRALKTVRFADVSQSDVSSIDLRQNDWTGRSTLVKHERRLRGSFDIARSTPPLDEVRLRERVVVPGVPVCAIGVWSADRRALIATGDGIQRELWIWSGTPNAVYTRVVGSSRNTRGCGWFLMAAAAATVFILVWQSVA